MVVHELPDLIHDQAQLEDLLSRPSDAAIDAVRRMQGDLVIIGGSGKIGPSLTGLALRARHAAGTRQKITVVARFSDAAVRQRLADAGTETVACDLLDAQAVARLCDAPNVIYMAGMKFGTTGRPDLTWAVNSVAPAYVAQRYAHSRIVAFSTGCVYPLVDVASGGSVEGDALSPLGEYSNSCVARERVMEYFANTLGTKLLLLRLNYAVEPRYGILVDLAADILAGRPVDVTMGYVNLIWQGDVNDATVRLLAHADNPPVALNLTGHQTLAIRDLAQELARLMGKQVRFVGTEAKTALLSNSTKAYELLGRPAVPIAKVLQWVAHWVQQGGATLGKPTHFQTRDGKY